MNFPDKQPLALEPSTSIHALAVQEREAERAVLAGIGQHFAAFAG